MKHLTSLVTSLLAALLCTAAAQAAEPVASGPLPVTSDRAQAFYYPWYGNLDTDREWVHWNHDIILQKGTGGHYSPPDEIGSNFYPALGLYSSNNSTDVDAHMRQMRDAGIGVLSVSWWGPGSYMDKAVPVIMRAAEKSGLKVNFHIEPYPGRNGVTFKENITYILDHYGDSPAFYRDASRGGRPMFYIYDSYKTPAAEWAKVLGASGPDTIRGTKYDAIVIGLWVKEHEEDFMLQGGFDGFYTYFATDGFVYGSTVANWPRLAAWAKDHGKLFIPSVGPGYDDTRVRPWNTGNRRDREKGAYYDRMWKAALAVRPEFVSITSFNEWHEGTQIEPATAKKVSGYTYSDYRPRTPTYYLERTRYWAEKFTAQVRAKR